MDTRLRSAVLMLLFLLPTMIFFSCSNSDDDEKSVIRKINENNIQAVKEYVHTPLEKAKNLKTTVDNKNKETEDTVNQE